MLKREGIKFYDQYYKSMPREHPKWMFTLYYPWFSGRVLEVGCGVLIAPYRNYIGVDLSLQALKKQSKLDRPVVWADGENLPFTTNSFDTVSCHEVLSYSSKPDKILSEMTRVAKSKIVIVDDNYILNKRFFRELNFKDWFKFLLYYLLSKVLGGYDKYWHRSPDFKEVRLPPKGTEAISAVNILFVNNMLTKMGFMLHRSSSFMYDEAGIAKRSFLKSVITKIPPLKYTGPMMYIVAHKKSERANS